MGYKVAKELMCMSHGHELRGDCWRQWGYQIEGAKGENWDYCNSIIKYFLNKLKYRNLLWIFKFPAAKTQ